MSELSIKYCDHKNPENYFFFTRDLEYKKVTIYQNSKVIQTITNVENLLDGLKFNDSLDREVSVQIVNKRNFTLSVIVDGEAYVHMKEVVEVKPIEAFDDKQISGNTDVRSIAWFFVILIVIQLINIMFFSQNNEIPSYQNGIYDAYPIYSIHYLTIPIICYAICIYVLHDNRGWAFFLGLAVLLIFTVLELYDFYLISIDRRVDYPYVILFSMIARLVILILLIPTNTKVIENIRANRSSIPNEMLDNS